MLSARFENTRAIDLLIVFLALLAGALVYETQVMHTVFTDAVVIEKLVITILLLLSFLLLQQINRWNELAETKNCYVLFFFAICIILFPMTFSSIRVVGANLLVLLVLWRILTLKTGEEVPQKLFDASLLVFCAGILHPWALVFLLNIWISLLFYGSEKRRYWLIPFLALIVILILGTAIWLLSGLPFQVIIDNFEAFDYTHITEIPNFNLPLATVVSLISLGVMLSVSLGVYYFVRRYHSISSQIVIQFLWVGLLVFFLSKEPIYLFAPIAIFFALYVERIYKLWLKETILWLLVCFPVVILTLHFVTKS